MTTLDNLIANWPAPSHITALTTMRKSGFSLPPYDNFNLALHVGDDPNLVSANREYLLGQLKLPSQPEWLNQTHTNRCICVDIETSRDGDAAVTRDPKRVLAIMTADCVPIVICNRLGTEIAAIHAGWRGLLNGIIDNTIAQLKSSPEDLMAWVGPCICADCYEVGDEVRAAFIQSNPLNENGFMTTPSHSDSGEPKWMANLPQLVENRLYSRNVRAVYQSNACTFEQKDSFYSYRRMPQTGRIATLI